MKPEEIEEEIAEARQRSAYLGGLFVGVMLFLLLASALIVVATYWPIAASVSASQPATKPVE